MQVFGLTEQVAVLPEEPREDPLAGIVGSADPDRAVCPLDRLDPHRDLAGIGRIAHRLDLDGAEQPGVDQRPPRLLDVADVVDLARAPPEAPLDIGRVEPFETADRRRAEAHLRSGVEHIGDRHCARFMVDDDPPVELFRERVAGLSERTEQRRFGRDDRLGAGRFAGTQRQFRGLCSGLFGAARNDERLALRSEDRDFGDMIERTRLGGDDNLGRFGVGIDPVGKLRVPIAEAVRRVAQQFEIAFGAPAQCLLRGRQPVLQALQLRDLAEKIGQRRIVHPGDLGFVAQIGQHRRPGEACQADPDQQTDARQSEIAAPRRRPAAGAPGHRRPRFRAPPPMGRNPYRTDPLTPQL